MVNKSALAKRIRKARETKGFTQGQLAKKIGVHQSEISKIETGNRDVGVIMLDKIATVLKVDLIELIYGKGK